MLVSNGIIPHASYDSPRQSAASSSVARSLVYSQNGAQFRFSDMVLSASCVNLTSGVLTDSDGTTEQISMPTLQSDTSGTQLTIFCLQQTTLADATQGLTTGEHTKCTNTYHACKKIGLEGNNKWIEVSPGCNKGLPYSMCEACYSAGFKTYAFLFITVVLQFPLVYLSMKRTSAAADSRCLKFWSLPVTLLVITGACISRVMW